MADQKLLKLTISRVDEPVFDGEVVSVSLPGVAGNMQLLANHEPLITPLKAGVVKIELPDNSVESYDIETGTLEVSNNHATVLI